MLGENKKQNMHAGAIIRRLTAAKVEKDKAKAFAKEFTGGLNLSYSKEYIDYKFSSFASDMEVKFSRLRSDIQKFLIILLTLQTIYLSTLALVAY